ncbi:MAG: LysR family transcriptional regulator [Betaproteobacteria bacterium]|nr:LysR family transcriptional regulator [Betaproteobacteria bacterium]
MSINATLKHLRCFTAIAREGSFTQAAKRMHLTQSSLTAAVQQLEQAVGLKLFDRTTRRVTLTREGASFVPVAERLVKEFDTAVADVRAVAERQRGHVSIAAAPSVVALVLAPAIAGFSAAYPNISVAVSDGGAELVQRRVFASEADFGITSRWADDPGLDFRPLICDRFGVVCRGDHPLGRAKTRLTWKRLQAERYIGLAIDTGIRTTLQSTPGLPAMLRTPHFEVSSTGSLHAMLDAGLGISVLPALAAHLAPLNQLAFRELVEPRLEREICVITRRGRALAPAAQSMLDVVAKHVQSHALPLGARLAVPDFAE